MEREKDEKKNYEKAYVGGRKVGWRKEKEKTMKSAMEDLEKEEKGKECLRKAFWRRKRKKRAMKKEDYEKHYRGKIRKGIEEKMKREEKGVRKGLWKKNKKGVKR